MTAKIKVLFGFYQVGLVLSTTYSARLPEKYTSWADKVARAIAIDWSGVFLPAQCVPYSSRLVATAVSPVGLIATLLLGGVGQRLHHWRFMPAPRPHSCHAAAALGLLDLTPAGLVIVFCFVPSVSASIFRSWSCQAYTISPPGVALEQIEYMRQDASVECGTDDHRSITILAGCLIVLWPLGSLILYSSLLIACYKSLQAKTSNALTRATAFLHREYKKTYFWWEAVELARKLTLTGVVLLIPEERAFLRLMVAILICSCYAVGIAVMRPYKRVEDVALTVATSLVLLLLFLVTSWITIFLGIEERYPNAEAAAAILGFAKLNSIVDTMIALIVAVLLFFFLGSTIAVRRVAMIPTIRLVSTKQPPELNVGVGITWHLFLSHIWRVTSLWREEEDPDRMIHPDSRIGQPVKTPSVLSRVDDLEDIGALEEYVQRTQMILFFLSQGYFRSQNCLREIRSSLEQSKPLVLVQEPDPAKGGALQALRKECPEDLQPDIFDKGWTHTIWMRIEEFQRVSLKTIVEAQRAVLLCSPDYLNRTSLPLCVPGEPEIQSLAFAKETILWASPANAGAQVLADEIADNFSNLTVSTAEEPGQATHMLLYLNQDSFSDERLAEQVKNAREARLPIVMAHENDPNLGGCAFSKFFETTPQERAGPNGHHALNLTRSFPVILCVYRLQELIADGLYKDLARSCFPGPHHKVSLVLLAKDLGAIPAWSANMSRLLGSIAKRLVPKISSATTNTAGGGSGGEAAISAEAAQENEDFEV